MKKTRMILLLLLVTPLLASPRAPQTLDEELAIDNQRVIKYLHSLKPSDAGSKLKGVKLSDGSTALKGYVFIECVKSAKNKSTVYIFRSKKKMIAYGWVEPKGKPLPIPACDSNYGEEGQYVLSGDVYTWQEINPGDGVVVMECVTDKWINEIKRQ